jgi:hypothetical protein
MNVFIPGAVPVQLTADVRDILADVGTFARLHRVQDKQTKQLVRFEPLPIQRKIFHAVRQGHNRIIIVKARQVAATTGAKMVLHWLASINPNT